MYSQPEEKIEASRVVLFRVPEGFHVNSSGLTLTDGDRSLGTFSV